MQPPADTYWSRLGDGEVLGRFVHRRDEAAFSELVGRHGGMVLGVCRSVLGSASDAEDAAQAVFLTLARKASSLRGAGPLVGWLHRVAWHVAARAAEARAIRRRHEQEAARMRSTTIPPDDSRISLEALHAGLEGLPEKYRIPILLHHIEGRTQEESAALLGCGVGAVAMRLNRGRELLRRRMAKRGVAATAGMLAAVLGTQASASASTTAVFVAATTKVAAAALAGGVGQVAVSAQTLALSKGAMNMLFWAKMKMVAAVAAVVVAAGAGTVFVAASPSPSPAPQAGFSGTITAVGDGSVTLQPKTGQPVVVTINSATVVKIAGQAATAADLKVGMAAYTLGQSQPATEIHAYTPQATPTPAPQPNVAGTITATGAGSVTIQPSSGSAVVVTINGSTVVKVGGQVTTAGSLAVGMRAYAIVPSGQAATSVTAYMPGTPQPSASPTAKPSPAPQPTVGGTITAVGSGSVTIQPPSGSAVVVQINGSTVVKVGGQVTTAGSLAVGMRAYAVVPSGQAATAISAYTPGTPKPSASPTAAPAPTSYSGTITAVGTGSITLQPKTGQPVVVTINNATVVKIGGQAATTADLKVGMAAYTIGLAQPATEIHAYQPK